MMKLFKFTWVITALITSTVCAQYPAKINVANLQQGDHVPDIIGKTIDGKDFNLHKDLKGKVVLLDFWATWCAPCIAETPNIKENYKKWQSKGFEVVAISLDGDVAKAKAYAKAKELKWLQLCDGLAFKSPVATSFQIRSIPQFILLNRDGTVISNNIRGTELTRVLDLVMTGKYVPTKAVNSQVTMTDKAQKLFSKLEQNLKSGTVEESLTTYRSLQKLGPKLDPKMMELAYHYRPLAGHGKHAKTIYLMADQVLSRGVVTQRQMRYAGVARAHAALHLGGSYVADLQLQAYRGTTLGTSEQYLELLSHKALVDKDADLLITTYHGEALSGGAKYNDVVAILKAVDSMGSATKVKELNELKYWISSQQNLPNDRARVQLNGNKITAYYKARNTNLAGSISINLMVVLESGQSFAIPMTLDPEKGVFTAITQLPTGSKGDHGSVRIYFRDTYKRADFNEGNYWLLK